MFIAFLQYRHRIVEEQNPQITKLRDHQRTVKNILFQIMVYKSNSRFLVTTFHCDPVTVEIHRVRMTDLLHIFNIILVEDQGLSLIPHSVYQCFLTF